MIDGKVFEENLEIIMDILTNCAFPVLKDRCPGSKEETMEMLELIFDDAINGPSSDKLKNAIRSLLKTALCSVLLDSIDHDTSDTAFTDEN